MAEVVWLASYPKSGNTWTRALLAGYYGDGAFELNALGEGIGIDGLHLLDDLLGIEAFDLRPEEILALKPAAARRLARDVADRDGPAVHKLHSANIRTAAGEPVFPPGAGRALYVVRNPLDVAASWAPFFSVSLDRAVAALGSEGCVLHPRGRSYTARLPEPLLSWSGHVASWLDTPGVPAHVLRYEDLLADPARAFTAALRFIGEAPEPGRVAAAVEAARFERLQAAEAAEGFHEHPRFASAPFFRRGRAGGWREALTPAQARRVVADHGPTMRRLGYGALVDEAEASPRYAKGMGD